MSKLIHLKYISFFLYLFLLGSFFFLNSCNVDEEYESIGNPSITLDEESGIYTIKAGKSITITPVIENAVNPVHSWKHEGKIVSTESSYTYQSKEVGEFHHTFRIDAENGSVEEDFRIDVVEKTPPVISFAIPEEGFITVVTGEELLLEPMVKFDQEATYKWVLDRQTVSEESTYLFKETEITEYKITLSVTNEDGEDTKEIIIRVTEAPTLSIWFENEEMRVPLGKTLMLSPVISYNTPDATYQWFIEEVLQPTHDPILLFKPETQKVYTIRIEGVDGENTTHTTVKVSCEAPEGEYFREVKTSSSSYSTKVFEYLPAPGQFINKIAYSTMEEACLSAEHNLSNNSFVSLGAFGGYIVVGFDHSILNTGEGKYDFAVYGNAFTGSSEPGIVWVMQDENGDGLPNDTWYELKGSETGKSTTIQNYAVTYYKPSAPAMPVQWTDNRGNSGTVDYLIDFHNQPYYYPNWVTTKSYTLRGTRLASKTYLENGTWKNGTYEWGYADNAGEDSGDKTNSQANSNPNYFSISNAIYPNGQSIHLEYIDFIKVQTGVNDKAGIIGEVSTEVFKFEDLHMQIK